MKSLATRLVIAVVTFTLGVGATVVWLFHREPVDVPAPIMSLPRDIDFADLADNPERYVGQAVRFRSIMFESDLALFRPGRPLATIGYDFAPGYEEEGWDRVRWVFEDDTPYIPHRSGPCERARATVTGTVIDDANRVRLKHSFRYWVMIQRIENVEKCPNL
jgi:hypothetical protein